MAKQRARPKPARFHAKLKQIRLALGYLQNEMLRALGLAEKSNRSLISGFELGTKEPNLLVILKYAKLINLSVV
ncbi:MAG TPA: helix-turn-helix transcriptional regulator [Pyrinomonadaceae bacterium]|jgi:transcriptional regulator with XRE-family HTH domain